MSLCKHNIPQDGPETQALDNKISLDKAKTGRAGNFARSSVILSRLPSVWHSNRPKSETAFRMRSEDRDSAIRMKAYAHVQMLERVYGQLTGHMLEEGFQFDGQKFTF